MSKVQATIHRVLIDEHNHYLAELTRHEEFYSMPNVADTVQCGRTLFFEVEGRVITPLGVTLKVKMKQVQGPLSLHIEELKAEGWRVEVRA